MKRMAEIAAIANRMDGPPDSLQPLPPHEALLLLDEIRALRGALKQMLPENCDTKDDPKGLHRPSFEKCEQARHLLDPSK